MPVKLFFIYVIVALMACNNHTKDSKGGDTGTSAIKRESETPIPVNTDTTKTEQVPNEPVGETLFMGLGAEPFWLLSIVKDKEIRFTSADGTEVSFPYAKLNKSGNEYRCISTKGRASIVLKITKQKCSDGMSETQYDYEVIAVVSTVTYRGCGLVKAASGSLDE